LDVKSAQPTNIPVIAPSDADIQKTPTGTTFTSQSSEKIDVNVQEIQKGIIIFI